MSAGDEGNGKGWRMSRCQCGAFIRRCQKCGATPGGEPDLFDPKRLQRIDKRALELRCDRLSVGGFIDAECRKVGV